MFKEGDFFPDFWSIQQRDVIHAKHFWGTAALVFFAMGFWLMQRRGRFFFGICCEVFRCFETKSEVFSGFSWLFFFSGNPGCNLKPSNMRVIDCKWRMGMNKDFWGRHHCVYLYTLIFKGIWGFHMSLMGRFARSLLKGLLYVTLKEGLNMTGFFHQKVFKKTAI